MARELRRITQQIKEYIPSGFEDEKKPLTLIFRTLTQREQAYFEDQSTRYDSKTGQMILGTSEIEYEIARTALIGWKNLIVEGKPVEFVIGYDGKLDESVIQDIELFSILSEAGRHISLVSKLP